MDENTKDGLELPTLAESSTTRDEERLPLYEEHAGLDGSTLPSKEATAAEVRGFIYHHLQSRSGLDETMARTISDKWTIGTGAELRTYPFTMYIDIFGPEPAWSIYSKVRTLILEAEQPAKQKQLRQTNLFCGGIAVILLGASIVCYITDHGVASILLGTSIIIHLIVWIPVVADLSKDPQKIIEEELRAAHPDRGKKQLQES